MKSGLVVVLLALCSVLISAQVEVNTEEVKLRLNGDWAELTSIDPEQRTFVSGSTNSTIVFSILKWTIKPSMISEAANRLLSIRLSVEKGGNSKFILKPNDSKIESNAEGSMAVVTYQGFDGENVIRYFGAVTQGKIVSMWLSTKTRDLAFSKRIYDSIAAAMKISIP